MLLIRIILIKWDSFLGWTAYKKGAKKLNNTDLVSMIIKNTKTVMANIKERIRKTISWLREKYESAISLRMHHTANIVEKEDIVSDA